MWNFCKASDSRKIERIQERALRTVFKSTSQTYEELLIRAKLPTLYNRRLQEIAILMYKVKNGLLATSCIQELFKTKNSGYSLRNSDFNIPRFNTIRYGKHSLRYQGPFIWSKLDVETRELSSLKYFKFKIRKMNLTGLINNNTNCCNLCNS